MTKLIHEVGSLPFLPCNLLLLPFFGNKRGVLRVLLRVVFCCNNFPKNGFGLSAYPMCWDHANSLHAKHCETTFGQTACDKLETCERRTGKLKNTTEGVRGPSVVHAWKSQILPWKSQTLPWKIYILPWSQKPAKSIQNHSHSENVGVSW